MILRRHFPPAFLSQGRRLALPMRQERLAVEQHINSCPIWSTQPNLDEEAVSAAILKVGGRNFRRILAVDDVAAIEQFQSAITIFPAHFDIACACPDRNSYAHLPASLDAVEPDFEIVTSVDGNWNRDPRIAARRYVDFGAGSRP